MPQHDHAQRRPDALLNFIASGKRTCHSTIRVFQVFQPDASFCFKLA